MCLELSILVNDVLITRVKEMRVHRFGQLVNADGGILSFLFVTFCIVSLLVHYFLFFQSLLVHKFLFFQSVADHCLCEHIRLHMFIPRLEVRFRFQALQRTENESVQSFAHLVVVFAAALAGGLRDEGDLVGGIMAT